MGRSPTLVLGLGVLFAALAWLAFAESALAVKNCNTKACVVVAYAKDPDTGFNAYCRRGLVSGKYFGTAYSTVFADNLYGQDAKGGSPDKDSMVNGNFVEVQGSPDCTGNVSPVSGIVTKITNDVPTNSSYPQKCFGGS